MALVFPGFMMMQMLSAGAIGGGISSAIARALGGGRRDDADALVVHALVVNVVLGLAFSGLFLVFGAWLYARMGGAGASLEAALAYSNVVFAGALLVWLMNALASVHSRHRQHAGAVAGGGRRRRGAGAAVAAADLRLGTDSGASASLAVAGAVVLTTGLTARRAGAGTSWPGAAWSGRRLARFRWRAFRRHPEGGRRGLGQHAADVADRRAHHRRSSPSPQRGCALPATARGRGSSTC